MRRSPLLTLPFLLLVTVTGCKVDQPGVQPSTSVTSSAASTGESLEPSIMHDALAKSMESTVTIVGTVGSGPLTIQLRGTLDPQADAVKLTMDLPRQSMEMILVDGMIYIRDETEHYWMSIESARLPPSNALHGDLGFAEYTGAVAGVITVEQTRPNWYAGLIDMHKAAAESQDASLVATLNSATNGSAVPYEARIDDEGRLVRLVYTIVLPSGPVVSRITLRDFGIPADIQAPPAAEVRPAPDELYENA